MKTLHMWFGEVIPILFDWYENGNIVNHIHFTREEWENQGGE